MREQPFICIRASTLLTATPQHRLSQLPRPSTMDADPRRQKRRDNVISTLNAAIEAMNLAKEFSSVTPAKPVFGSVSVLLTMIRVRVLPFFNDKSQVYM